MSSTSPSSAPASSHAARTIAGAAALGRIGSWEFVRLIGEGRMSSVYQARPTGSRAASGAGYAVKVLRPEWQDDSRGLAFLARELHVARKVNNSHLVPILAAQLDAPPYYLAMPLLEGSTLAERMRAEAQLELPAVFWIGRQIAEALEALHTAGWMHSDVKPTNVFVSPTGHVTLFDLGFARAASERGTIADRPVLGTMSYIAPEMLYSDRGGDIHSDVYSLGVTLFEMLTGRLPFDAEDIAELAAQHRQDIPIDLRHLAPHLPTRAARLVQQMLAKEPLRRPMPSDLVDRFAALEIETFTERCVSE